MRVSAVGMFATSIKWAKENGVEASDKVMVKRLNENMMRI